MVSAKRINKARAEFTAQVLSEQEKPFPVTGNVTFFADNDYTGLTSVCQARVNPRDGRATCTGFDLDAHTVYAVFTPVDPDGWASSRSATASIPA